MKYEPGFLTSLKSDLEIVKPDYQDKLKRSGGMTTNKLVNLVATSTCSDLIIHAEHPTHMDVTPYNSIDAECELIGRNAIKAGEVAYVILAGGAGTRLSEPKALLRIPGLGMSLLANKLAHATITNIHSVEPIVAPHVWIMTSPSLTKELMIHLTSLIPGVNGIVFEQFESFRLRPDNSLDLLGDGNPDLYPTGHGDLGPALIENKMWDLPEHSNIKYVLVTNVDNVRNVFDPLVIGHHIVNKNKITCEVVKRDKDDLGGSLAWSDGTLQVVESFRLDDDFVKESKYHNTNTMILNKEVLEKHIDWKWYRIRKKVGNKLAVQYERLLQQYTAEYKTDYILVDRDSYLPVKIEKDLEIVATLLNGNNK